jgi:glycosyltransferase involved in cell wall biosynthesis
MNIAVYYPWVYLTSGVERTIFEMCHRSRHRYTIFTNHYEPESTYPEFHDLQVISLPSIPVSRNLAAVFTAAMRIGTQKLDIGGYDGLLVHCDGLGNLVLNRATNLPAICLCHTPLRPVYDPHYRARAMSRFGNLGTLAFKTFSMAFATVDKRMWQRYRYVIFNSQETLSRAKGFGLLNYFRGRFEVLHPGVDWHGYKPTWHYEPYFLVAGRIMWTKNIETAISAFAQFKARSVEHRRFRLVIAGRVDKKSEVYIAKLRDLAAATSDVEFVVSPSEEQLRALYSNCYAVVFPAFNEDWGLVPLEANAFGKPVIASNRGGPVESQQHNVTGLLVPCDCESFANAMSDLAKSIGRVRSLGHGARRASRSHDWSNFVERMDLIIEAVVRGEDVASVSTVCATDVQPVSACADCATRTLPTITRSVRAPFARKARNTAKARILRV